MKILWFTSSASKAALEFGYKSFGVSWVSALQDLLVGANQHELRICFFYDGNVLKSIKKDNVTYYGIPFSKGNAASRVLKRHRAQLIDEDPSSIDGIIDEYKPDIIHVFGTENGYGKILRHRKEKVVFTLQGMVAAITDVYFPPGFNKRNVFLNSSLSEILRGLTISHEYRIFRQWAKREKETIVNGKYFIGRTGFDRNYVQLLNNKARYFHCEDMLRSDFFNDEWTQPSKPDGDNAIVIGSIFTPNLYKGLDLVYRVMELMKDYNIHWKVIGTGEKDLVNRVVKKVLRMNQKELKLELLGQISTGELVKQLKTCDLFVHPSYIENGPISVCEAMLMGMPVLSSSVGGTKSIMENNKTGFLFNPYDKYELAGLIAHLSEHFDEAINVGRQARETALIRHSADGILDKLHKIYSYIYEDNH